MRRLALMLFVALVIASSAFIAGLHYTILEANTSVPPQLPAPLFWSVLGGFIAATLSCQALFYLRFRTPH